MKLPCYHDETQIISSIGRYLEVDYEDKGGFIVNSPLNHVFICDKHGLIKLQIWGNFWKYLICDIEISK